MTGYTVEFFKSPSCDSSSHGEGQTFLIRTTVTTNGSGFVSILAFAPDSFVANEVITALATDTAGDGTSEFSACFSATAGVATAVDVRTNVAGRDLRIGWLVGLWGGLLLLSWWLRPKFRSISNR